MIRDNVISLHFRYTYTYFITISARYQYQNAKTIFEFATRFLRNHDHDCKIMSVKELTTITKNLHYHMLYFTSKKLDYEELHAYIKNHNIEHADINIQLVPKTTTDIKNVYRYMQKQQKQ